MAYDIPSISDLEAIQLLNKHYAEVITSKEGGVSSAADITQTTNPITGVTRRTLYKILDDMDDTFLERLLKMAFTPVGTFTAGATLTDARQTLLWEVSQGGDGHYYSWSGSFGTSGKVVSAGSTPSEPEWVDRTDDSLRDEIRETVFQNMKRLAAEAGFNLVDGSFQTGAVTVNQNDVVWDWSSGKYYGGVIGSVSAGSTPATTGGIGAGAWVDRTNVTLRNEINIVQKRFASVADMLSYPYELHGTISSGCTTWKVIQNSNYRSIQTQGGYNLIPLNGFHVVDNNALGLGSASEATDTAALQDSINKCCKHGWPMIINEGEYHITSTLHITFTENNDSLNITGLGVAYPRYKNPDRLVAAKLKASTNVTWDTDTPILYSHGSSGTVNLKNILFIGNNELEDGIDNGTTIGYKQNLGGKISDCGFYRNRTGLDSNNRVMLKDSTFGKNGWYGAVIRHGDSLITDCYFSDHRRDMDDSATSSTRGAALLLQKANNTSIKGGKIESSQRGLYIYRTQGVNISSINFDYCRFALTVYGDVTGEEAYVPRSINITNCRFLASIYRHLTIVNNTEFTSYGTVTGCSFARGNSDAYDNNTTGLSPTGAYPTANHISLTGTGTMDWTISCTVQTLAAATPGIYFPAPGTLRLSGNTTPYLTVDTGTGTGRVIREANHFHMLALPTVGTWNHGDVVEIRYPNANSTQSWTCVSSGTYGETNPIWQESNILGAKRAAAMANISAGPTKEDFNNLLSILKTAGLMKY